MNNRKPKFFFLLILLFGISSGLFPSDRKKKDVPKKEKASETDFEKEDLLMELSISSLQREILQEKFEVLNSEMDEQNDAPVPTNIGSDRKKRRLAQNMLYPGLGTWNSGEKFKGGMTMSFFGFFTLAFFASYRQTSIIRRDIGRLPYYEYTEQFRLTDSYRTGIQRTNLLLAGTALIYLWNIFESNEWNGESGRNSGQNGQSFLMQTQTGTYEKTYLFSVEIPMEFRSSH